MIDPEGDIEDQLTNGLFGEGEDDQVVEPEPEAELPDSKKPGKWYRRIHDGFKARITDETWEAYDEAYQSKWEPIPALGQAHPEDLDNEE